jgi:hypothetical protein
MRFHTYFLSPSHLILIEKRTSLFLKTQCLDGLYHQPARTILLCHCVSKTHCRWYRNINLLSIAYDDTVLGLGPDLPWEDEPSPGNLRLSTVVILTPLSLLMPAFSLPCSPPLLPVRLQPACDAPLPRNVPTNTFFYNSCWFSKFFLKHLTQALHLICIKSVGLLECRPLLLPQESIVGNAAPIASVVSFSPGHFRRTITRLVSCYALFK